MSRNERAARRILGLQFITAFAFTAAWIFGAADGTFLGLVWAFIALDVVKGGLS